MNVLIVAPHMDDKVLGCGGTITRHIEKGDMLFICFIAHRLYNHQFDKKKNDIEKHHAITEQSPSLYENAFLPNYYVDITKHINRKIKAYRHYKKEKRPFPHPRSEDAIKILAQKRGVEIGFDYAESFIMLRDKWK